MANMIPGLIKHYSSGNPLHQVFESLRQKLPDTFDVLHSFNLENDDSPLLYGVDAVVISSEGIIGVCTARDGAPWLPWYSQGLLDALPDRLSVPGPISTLRDQFKLALRRATPKLFEGGDPAVGVGFAIWSGHDKKRCEGTRIVLNIDSNPSELQRYFHELIEFWNRPTKRIAAEGQTEILQSLRQELDRRSSLVVKAGEIEAKRIKLTESQYELFDAFDISRNPRLLIEGGAGTGKTLCALDIAQMEAARGKRVLLSCFNANLAKHMNMLLDTAIGSGESTPKSAIRLRVSHIHDVCRTLAHEAGFESELAPPWEGGQHNLNELYRSIYPAVALRAIDLLGYRGIYDSLVVDEAQDILNDEAYLSILDALLKDGINSGSWAVFHDPRQLIYNQSEENMEDIYESSLSRLRSTRPFEHTLDVNCRNSSEIAEVAGAVSGIDPIKNGAIVTGISSQIIWYDTIEDQVMKISQKISDWIGSGISPDRFVILSRYTLPNSGLKDGLDANLVDLDLVNWDSAMEARPTGSIVFSTIHNFKGLESEFVILADVDNLDEEWRTKLYYVGITRANTAVTVSASTDIRIPVMSALQHQQSNTIETVDIGDDIGRPQVSELIDRSIRSGAKPLFSVSESRRAAQTYLSETPTKPDTWWGTIGPVIYELSLCALKDIPTYMSVKLRVIGHDGSLTQVRLATGDDDAGKYIFVDENGNCEHEYCPVILEESFRIAPSLHLTTSSGAKVRLMIRN